MKVRAYKIQDSAGKTYIIQMQDSTRTQTKNQILCYYVSQGTISYEDAMNRSHNPAELEVLISSGMARMQAAANRRRKKES